MALWTGSELLVSSGPMMMWDPDTLTWRTTNQPPGFSPVPYGAWAAGEAVFYGSRWDPHNAAGAAYDPVADTWRSIAPGPETIAAGFHVMASSGDEVYVFGSYSENTQSQSDAVYDPATDSWRVLPPIPDEFILSGSFGDFVNDEFIIMGENWKAHPTGSPPLVGLAYSALRDAWRTIAGLRDPARDGGRFFGSLAAVRHGEKLGGKDRSSPATRSSRT
ncbi:MAG: kelch repeat-containing protein [Acidimicrobiia bacterium]